MAYSQLEDDINRKETIEVGEDLSTQYSVRILWGEHPADDQDIEEYRFATEAELKAFYLGCEAAEGWMGFHVIETPEEIQAHLNNTWVL